MTDFHETHTPNAAPAPAQAAALTSPEVQAHTAITASPEARAHVTAASIEAQVHTAAAGSPTAQAHTAAAVPPEAQARTSAAGSSPMTQAPSSPGTWTSPYPHAQPPVPPAPRPLTAAPRAESFGVYGPVCLAMGFFDSFCFYKNPSSITWPLFSAVGYLVLCVLFKRLGLAIKKDSWFLMGTSFLVSLSMCLTGSTFLHACSRLALLLLLAVFLNHQLYEDRAWQTGTWFFAILRYGVSLIGLLPVPFRHAAVYAKSGKASKSKNVLLVLSGICTSIPLTVLVVWLLGSADAVFSDLISRLFHDFFRLETLISISAGSLFAAVIFYSILCTRFAPPKPQKEVCRKNGNPLAAVSFLGAIVLFYGAFCVIQIYCLFLRQGSLPESMTYAQYAHQGFYQLVFVVFINLALVLGFLKYIRPTLLLRLTLTFLSICTVIMTFSAAYRMVLYVASYHLTLLRLLVLWFLAMTTVLMAGIFRLIFKDDFPLFRYGLVVISVFYVALAFARPDAVIARYNLTHESVSNSDLYYLQSLSTDAAPALLEYLPTDESCFKPWGSRKQYLQSFINHQPERSFSHSLRRYNFSVARAKRLFGPLFIEFPD